MKQPLYKRYTVVDEVTGEPLPVAFGVDRYQKTFKKDCVSCGKKYDGYGKSKYCGFECRAKARKINSQRFYEKFKKSLDK